MHPYDKVTKNGKTVGISTWVGYSANDGQMLTLAILEPEHAAIGNEVTFVWGEENGGTAKPAVERHEQIEMRATVSPVPYSEVARTEYAGEGWRTARADPPNGVMPHSRSRHSAPRRSAKPISSIPSSRRARRTPGSHSAPVRPGAPRDTS